MSLAATDNFYEAKISIKQKFINTLEVIGYARAAGELSRQGYHEEARRCMMEIKKLKSN